MSELQRLTERLGERLARSVAIDNVHLQLQAYSPHYGAVDEQRLNSILHREASPEAVAWAVSHGMQRAVRWIRIPPNPEQGMLSRVCIPIRFDQVRLGYLWLIDADESMTDEDLELATAAAAEAADIMHRESLTSGLRAARERELLRDLIDNDAVVRRQSLSRLAEEALLDLHRPAQALVLDLTHVLSGRDGLTDHDVIDGAEVALTSVRSQLPARRSLHLTRPDHGLLLLVPDAAHDIGDVAERLIAEYRRYARRPDAPVIVGVGSPSAGAEDFVISYERARTAAQVGQILDLNGMVEWSSLGIYRLLAVLPREEVVSDVLHPGLARLADASDGPALLETLETFLDRAGDVTASARALFLHRATLYNRLAKIERVGGVDLKRGSDRLDLHLSLKLARLHQTMPAMTRAPASLNDDGPVPCDG